MNITVMPTIPAAKNFGVFSLFLCLKTWAKAFALAAAVTVEFAMSQNQEPACGEGKNRNKARYLITFGTLLSYYIHGVQEKKNTQNTTKTKVRNAGKSM